MIQTICNILNQLCMTFVNAGKGCLDVYGGLVAGILGCISQLGSALGGVGTGVAVGGAITVGGLIAANGAATTPPGQLLGKPAAATTTTAQPVANAPLTQIASALPGALSSI